MVGWHSDFVESSTHGKHTLRMSVQRQKVQFVYQGILSPEFKKNRPIKNLHAD